MTTHKRPLLVYICHPITTGRLGVKQNLDRIDAIRRYYVRTGRIPMVPSDILRGVYPTDGDQTSAYAMCRELLRCCDEIHLFDGWKLSRGCIDELKLVYEHEDYYHIRIRCVEDNEWLPRG